VRRTAFALGRSAPHPITLRRLFYWRSRGMRCRQLCAASAGVSASATLL
jgi:hypothetical protein